MNVQHVSHGDMNIADALDTIELELALQVQDIHAAGFDGVLSAALASLGGQFLFRLPSVDLADTREVAAVSLPLGTEGDRKLLLVHLAGDGESLRVEDAAFSESPVAAMAKSFAGVLDTLAAASEKEDEPILL